MGEGSDASDWYRLTPRVQRLLDSIYSFFRVRGTWPTYADIAADLGSEQQLLGALGEAPPAIFSPDPSLFPPREGDSSLEPLGLTVRGLSMASGAADDLELFLRAVKVVAGAAERGRHALSLVELGRRTGAADPDALVRMVALLLLEPELVAAIPDTEPGAAPSLPLQPTARGYLSVSSLRDYLERRPELTTGLDPD